MTGNTEKTTEKTDAEKLIEKVDKAGDLAREIEEKTGELEVLKVELQAEASKQCDNGTAVVLTGNLFKGTVAFSAEFNDLNGIERDLDKIDEEQGTKLIPLKGKKPHKTFTGNQDTIKELKTFLDDEDRADLFKSNFTHVPSSIKRTPDKTALGKMARTDVIKHTGMKAEVLKFIKKWTPKSIAFTRKKKEAA